MCQQADGCHVRTSGTRGEGVTTDGLAENHYNQSSAGVNYADPRRTRPVLVVG
jgi:hypothetical protein